MEGSKTTKTTQKGNHADGDMAGRDVNKYTYNTGNSSASAQSQLEILYEKLEKEKNESRIFSEIIDELQHFKAYSGAEVVGLEKKLEDGDRLAYLEFAIRSKEKFAKKLLENEHSETSQKIYAFLLAKVYASFSNYIYPKLSEGHPEEHITNLIRSHIVQPIESVLGENLLNIYEDEIDGMIYFLTGNCHIKWI